ncbi:hypothetical protein Fmac_032150 [Flemingia macrophylla]|uniref:Calmodulin-binding domain-containing protein n=1 Tax=Flemingia macrophylla TaxID=520843 RepID=A0ABD1L441_9FABA
MATKAKESTVVGKEKKAPSSDSRTTTTKRTTKPSTTTTSSTNKPNLTPSKKTVPNYVKPTLTSHLDSPSSRQRKSDSPYNKPTLTKRRSLEKTLSSSNLTKQTQPPNSTLRNALVSHVPRERSTPRTSSIGLATRSTNPSKPISDRTSKTPNIGKSRPLVSKSTKKITLTTTASTTSSTKKKGNKDHVSVSSTKRTTEEIKESLNVETDQVKEVASQEVEVIKVENEEHKIHEVEHVTDISPDVGSEHEIERVLEHDNSDSHHSQVDNERVIYTAVSEAEETENKPLEEKAKDEEQELEEDKINQDEGGNNSDSDHQDKHFTTEGVVKNKGEGEVIIIEDHEIENNNSEEGAIEKEKEAVEEIEKAKFEATPLKQQLGERKHRNTEALSNDMIEETKSKLLVARKNKVMALAGAFQTVIDHQTSSK